MTTTEIGPVLLALCAEDPPPGHAPELENAKLIRLANRHGVLPRLEYYDRSWPVF